MVFPQGSGTLLLRLLAPFQRHSWDASGEAEGDLPPCRSSLGVDSPFKALITFVLLSQCQVGVNSLPWKTVHNLCPETFTLTYLMLYSLHASWNPCFLTTLFPFRYDHWCYFFQHFSVFRSCLFSHLRLYSPGLNQLSLWTFLSAVLCLPCPIWPDNKDLDVTPSPFPPHPPCTFSAQTFLPCSYI